MYVALPPWVRKRPSFSHYKILFHFKALLWESIILFIANPSCKAYPDCNIIARPLRNIRPPYRAPLLIPYPMQYW